ncbi:hypothetical protein BC829DRAFT_413223 [Chytridium lagenaria]|nr:hypothetical protein BC829DRAFT_413223 [Chytridium lagenaria]
MQANDIYVEGLGYKVNGYSRMSVGGERIFGSEHSKKKGTRKNAGVAVITLEDLHKRSKTKKVVWTQSTQYGVVLYYMLLQVEGQEPRPLACIKWAPDGLEKDKFNNTFFKNFGGITYHDAHTYRESSMSFRAVEDDDNDWGQISSQEVPVEDQLLLPAIDPLSHYYDQELLIKPSHYPNELPAPRDQNVPPCLFDQDDDEERPTDDHRNTKAQTRNNGSQRRYYEKPPVRVSPYASSQLAFDDELSDNDDRNSKAPPTRTYGSKPSHMQVDEPQISRIYAKPSVVLDYLTEFDMELNKYGTAQLVSGCDVKSLSDAFKKAADKIWREGLNFRHLPQSVLDNAFKQSKLYWTGESMGGPGRIYSAKNTIEVTGERRGRKEIMNVPPRETRPFAKKMRSINPAASMNLKMLERSLQIKIQLNEKLLHLETAVRTSMLHHNLFGNQERRVMRETRVSIARAFPKRKKQIEASSDDGELSEDEMLEDEVMKSLGKRKIASSRRIESREKIPGEKAAATTAAKISAAKATGRKDRRKVICREDIRRQASAAKTAAKTSAPKKAAMANVGKKAREKEQARGVVEREAGEKRVAEKGATEEEAAEEEEEEAAKTMLKLSRKSNPSSFEEPEPTVTRRTKRRRPN